MTQRRRTAGEIALHDALVEQNTPRLLNVNVILSILLGGGLLAFLFWPRKADVAVLDEASKLPDAQPEALALFRQSIGDRAKPYVDMILTAAFERASYGVKPLELATMLYGLGEAETRWGTTRSLDKPGPGGTGDYILRCWKDLPKSVPAKAMIQLFEKPPGWTMVKSRKCDDQGVFVPKDGLGFGRGLMQIDYMWNYDWIASGADWRDPLTNIRKGADILMTKVRQLSQNGLTGSTLRHASIAAYNAGADRVLEAVRKGNDPDSVTFSPSYSKNVLAFMRTVTDEYTARGGVLV